MKPQHPSDINAQIDAEQQRMDNAYAHSTAITANELSTKQSGTTSTPN